MRSRKQFAAVAADYQRPLKFVAVFVGYLGLVIVRRRYSLTVITMSPEKPSPIHKISSARPGDGFTIDVVARSEAVSVGTIRRWVREKKFPAPVKRGGTKGKCVWYPEMLDAARRRDAA